MLVVPEVRKSFFGWKPVERPPTTYPGPSPSGARTSERLRSLGTLLPPLSASPYRHCPTIATAVPNRPRDTALTGYEDGWKPTTA